MRSKLVMAMVCAIALAGTTGVVSAKGCLKGAAVGGVAGHVAGHHGLVGAAGGCVVGRHMANKKAAKQNMQTAPAAQTTTAK
ncbi:hypothetical protein [Glaciimonas immobilis]|uniref:Glycine zipper 2TM domain-containing protein n=1 Tax=Glaciimonas immobilis TaxID=728004 RepID=A0A840RSA2_9BURK|nr:hypothetical protein [Glaciimonas immobilis]KAF3997044.1 hypothetical protein HAV38_15330 [Glaciimonas immobilis]MBB5199888.1 hypothetical protein [Glaciimonas immobilis]